jgi:hypothetical protein
VCVRVRMCISFSLRVFVCVCVSVCVYAYVRIQLKLVLPTCTYITYQTVANMPGAHMRPRLCLYIHSIKMPGAHMRPRLSLSFTVPVHARCAHASETV